MRASEFTFLPLFVTAGVRTWGEEYWSFHVDWMDWGGGTSTMNVYGYAPSFMGQIA